MDINTDRKKFWSLKTMGKELENEFIFKRRCVYIGFKMFLILNCLIYLTMIIKAIYFQELPLPCWSPEGLEWKIGIIIFQLVTSPFPILVSVCFDCLFSAAYMEAYFQFRLLNSAFSNLNTLQEIEKCHMHQHFLFG